MVGVGTQDDGFGQFGMHRRPKELTQFATGCQSARSVALLTAQGLMIALVIWAAAGWAVERE
jgi:hypothetical protein